MEARNSLYVQQILTARATIGANMEEANAVEMYEEESEDVEGENMRMFRRRRITSSLLRFPSTEF